MSYRPGLYEVYRICKVNRAYTQVRINYCCATFFLKNNVFEHFGIIFRGTSNKNDNPCSVVGYSL